jgi:predicted nucleic acid-binding protein
VAAQAPYDCGRPPFVALAEALAEPLFTKDRALADAAARHAGVEVLAL